VLCYSVYHAVPGPDHMSAHMPNQLYKIINGMDGSRESSRFVSQTVDWARVEQGTAATWEAEQHGRAAQ
jgi:hypothetical protein